LNEAVKLRFAAETQIVLHSIHKLANLRPLNTRQIKTTIIFIYAFTFVIRSQTADVCKRWL